SAPLSSASPLSPYTTLFRSWFLRRAQGANNQALSFGKSRARLADVVKPATTFADVAGVEEARIELQEVVEFLKEPQKFSALGARSEEHTSELQSHLNLVCRL